VSDQPSPPPEPGPAERQGPARLAGALPFLLTAAAAVLLSLALQALIWPRQAPEAVLFNTATPGPSAPAAPTTAPGTPSASPVPPPRESDVGVLRLDILDLEAEDRRLRSSLYLLRASIQLGDAEAALQANDLAEADRAVMTARRSLDQAYAFSAEQDKGPIDTFRLQASQIRDDMRLRPEGADRRLRQLRQLVLALVDEGT